MVSIFTYRDERKLFAVIGAVIAAAIVALIQLSSVRTGKPSPISTGVTTVALPAQSLLGSVSSAIGGTVEQLTSLPQQSARVRELTDRVRDLETDNARLRETAAAAPEDIALARSSKDDPAGIPATVVGYDPENESRTISIDRGYEAGVAVDDGVVSPDGIVGRVIEVDPFSSKILLAIDTSSQVPAVVQRGRWWGIASGTSSRVSLRFVSQDAKLKAGDFVVTGEGHSFHAGLTIGRIARVSHPEGALYQTATVEPAVAFGRLHRVLVVPH